MCARLPYGVFCEISDADEPCKLETIRFNGEYFLFNNGASERYITEIKPYLRPMSSMTDAEKNVYDQLFHVLCGFQGKYSTISMYDWLNRRHFDYWGLIEMGLALELPENMY